MSALSSWVVDGQLSMSPAAMFVVAYVAGLLTAVIAMGGGTRGSK